MHTGEGPRGASPPIKTPVAEDRTLVYTAYISKHVKALAPIPTMTLGLLSLIAFMPERSLADDVVGDFSITLNPNGSWSYGWEANLGGAFTLDAAVTTTAFPGINTWIGTEYCGGETFFPLVGFNRTGTLDNYASGISQPANMLNLHPSCSGKLSVVRWTAPTTGSFNIVGLFQGIDTRDTSTDVHILQNSATSLFSANINGYGNQAPFTLTRSLIAGDTLDFIVGFGADAHYDDDSTGLALNICAAQLVCPTTGGPATYNIADGDVAGLIAAIRRASGYYASSTINLAPNGTYNLTSVADNSPDYQSSGAAGLPYIRGQLTINGNGSTIQRVPGSPDFTVLEVSGYNPPGQNNARLILNGTTISGGSLGGLHMTYASAFVQNSTITQNTGASGINNTCGNLTLLNSTVSYNSNPSAYGGGGIFLWQFLCPPNTPTANVSFSTIYENANPGWGRGNAIGTNAPSGQVTVKNSILASPSHPNEEVCNAGALVSYGHNIGGDASCTPALTGPGDIKSTNPLLGPTVNNGGPTPTDLPAKNSPAIDAVPLGACSDVFGVPVTTDQRGIARPQGATCDIGSVELVQGAKYHTCVLYDPTKAVQSGATDPIKLQLCDASGNDLSSSNITLHSTGITQVSTSISGAVQSAGNANPDSDFRFDLTLGPTGGYIFNLSTSGLTTGSYKLNFSVTGDSFAYSAPFQVK